MCVGYEFSRVMNNYDFDQGIIKGELQPKISLLHMKVITLIKAKCNVFLSYVQC